MKTPAEGASGSPSRPRLPPVVRGIAAASIALFWLVLLLLTLAAGLPLLDGLLLAVLLVAVPGASLAQLPLVPETPIERMPAYWSSITTLWLLGAACWFVGTRDGGAEAVGFVVLPWKDMVAWSIGLTLAGLLTILAFRQWAIWSRMRESPMLRHLLPQSHEERHAFGVLSVAAGFGEEIAYRGYAIPVLTPLLGVPWAAAVSSMVFGVLHGYQGGVGILRTGVMGGVLAWGFLTCGSLWPAVIAHTVIDLVAGLWLRERLLSPEPAAGVGSESGMSPFER